MYFCKLFQTVKKQGTILESLDRFIRKYYKNRMIKGVIYSLALLLSLFLLITLLEYFGYFGSVVRAILFWLYLVIALFVLGYYIAVPLAKMYRIGKVISYEEAAVIVGNHFPEIKDSLLNLLQLQEQKSDRDDELLRMAIEQKTAQLKPLEYQGQPPLCEVCGYSGACHSCVAAGVPYPSHGSIPPYCTLQHAV